jgi:hypothetical protein
MKYLLILILFCLFTDCFGQQVAWPNSTRETKPWSRWWWHGSAVTKEGITAELEAFKKAGLGGLEITPIYGVHSFEKRFVDYLSPQWLDVLKHTLAEAERLDLGIDMATGTGWPFGGPWISETDACKNIEYKTYNVRAGEKLREKVSFIQQPYVRAVGNQVYEVRDSAMAGEHVKVTSTEPRALGKAQITIEQLVDPVEANKNLQALALDQVKFRKELPLQTLMAYSDGGRTVELTQFLDKEGNLQWTAPSGNWTLYALFTGWHGKMVERAGPGGEGNVIDHFSSVALKNYLSKFDEALKNFPLEPLRAFFNDSYEVDDARGVADWTPLLFQEFKSRRGYDLKDHLPALLGKDSEEKNQRILCDYRETISELILENFTRPWKTWAHGKNAIVRNQAHGSPANILDLYATVDIPEIEGIEPLRIKMASSAGNVTGKRLISSESATWLNEHFESNLSDIKLAVDRFLLHGVNHIFYHGTSYSPADEPWPGWLFYAAVHLNPRNPLWSHFPALNKYIERAQSLLQNSKPDNDVLLYYPIYERFSTRSVEMIEHFDGVGAQFDNTIFKKTAEMMIATGYSYDYISDKQIANIQVSGSNLITEGNSTYKTIVLPRSRFVPMKTFTKLLSLADGGATVILIGGPPENISGFGNFEANNKAFQDQLAKLRKGVDRNGIKEIKYGKGRILIGDSSEKLLENAAIRRETLATQDLQFLRKKTSVGNTVYFISNGSKVFSGPIHLQADGHSVAFYNAMTDQRGFVKSETSSGRIQTHLTLQPFETIFIEVRTDKAVIPAFNQVASRGKSLTLDQDWTIEFNSGGPQIPPGVAMKTLDYWTVLKDSVYKSFSGCATYRIQFDRPKYKSNTWILQLGDVQESAEVIVNGSPIGTVLGPTYEISLDDAILKDQNVLELRVCNLMANRIAFMDQNRIFWKKFYNVNFPSRKAENRKNNLFDAAHWQVHESGLKGPVRLVQVLAY